MSRAGDSDAYLSGTADCGRGGKALSVEEMAERLKGAHTRKSEIAQATGKPIVFGECGCPSVRNAAAAPSGTRIVRGPPENEMNFFR